MTPMDLAAADHAAIFGHEVDLVDLFAADAALRVQVIDHGHVLFERTPADRARFEMHALSRYAHLNEERRTILDDVVQWGSIHG